MQLESIALLFASFILVFLIHEIFRLRDTASTIGYHPGQRWIIPQINIIVNMVPFRVPFLFRGRNFAANERHDVFKEFGWDVLSFLSLFSRKVVFYLADAAVIKDITSNRARFPKPVYYYLLLSTFGYNIVVSEGELWKKYRKISAPAFSERNTKLVWDETIQTLTELFEQVWGDQDVVTLDHCLDMTFPLVLNVLSAAGFGRRLLWTDEGVVPQGHKMTFHQAIHVVLTDFAYKLILPGWALSLTVKLRRVRDAFDELRLYICEMIQEGQTGNISSRDDLFSNLLKANDEDDTEANLDIDELISNIYVFFVAGVETNSHALCFTLGLLALYPEEQEELYKRIRSILSDGRVPTYSDAPLFTYSTAVFYEALRMYPPVSYIPKVADTDTSITCTNVHGETRVIPVPKGTEFTILPHALHYNPRYWEDPHTFKPERFLKDWPRDAFVPFSAGPRSCIGRKFAETEAIAAITYIVSRYKISIKEEPQFANETFEQKRDRVLKTDQLLTLTPMRVPLVFTRRT